MKKVAYVRAAHGTEYLSFQLPNGKWQIKFVRSSTPQHSKINQPVWARYLHSTSKMESTLSDDDWHILTKKELDDLFIEMI